MLRVPFHRINWPTSLFLCFTMLLALTAVPLYLWQYGVDWFEIALFVVLFICSSMSITLGYHRLFAHFAFRAKWPVRLFTLVFGAGSFEGSAMDWASDHRRHHKHVDHDDDPYDITKGFFHAHVGWLLFKLRPEPPMDNVNDLKADRLVAWQHKFFVPLAVFMGFILPALLGFAWNGVRGAVGGLLFGGVLRVVCVQHSTFFINSLCHTIGRRPYSTRCTARDSWLMAIFTFGEGYHNYHHEFQHDYRNGVKAWQFDPTKWAIWLLSRCGLAHGLRRVPAERIQLAEIAERQRNLEGQLQAGLIPVSSRTLLQRAQERLQAAAATWEQRKAEYAKATEKRIEASREKLLELKHEFERAAENLRLAIRQWHETHRLITASAFAA